MKIGLFRRCYRGDAWLLSARVVRCRVKSHNERNPFQMLQLLLILPRPNGEEGGDDIQSSCPLCPGLHRHYNGDIQWAAKPRGGANPIKDRLSSDCRLQLACMKLELLVIGHQHGPVNTFSGLVHTARQGMGVAHTRSLRLSWPKVMGGDWA